MNEKNSNSPASDSHPSDSSLPDSSSSESSSPEPSSPDSRRQFLQGAGIVAGALVLSRVPASAAPGDAVPNAPATTTTLNLADHPELAKVGGFEIVDVGAERVIVAHTATGFTACSAKCPHRGCEVEYSLAKKQFVCPCHNSLFDETGKVVKGPAKTDLKPFDSAQAIVVKPK